MLSQLHIFTLLAAQAKKSKYAFIDLLIWHGNSDGRAFNSRSKDPGFNPCQDLMRYGVFFCIMIYDHHRIKFFITVPYLHSMIKGSMLHSIQSRHSCYKDHYTFNNRTVGYTYNCNILRFACPYFIPGPMLLFPSLLLFSVTGKALSSKKVNLSLVPKSELHALLPH